MPIEPDIENPLDPGDGGESGGGGGVTANFCPFCGRRVEQHWSYCPDCGKKLPW